MGFALVVIIGEVQEFLIKGSSFLCSSLMFESFSYERTFHG